MAAAARSVELVRLLLLLLMMMVVVVVLLLLQLSIGEFAYTESRQMLLATCMAVVQGPSTAAVRCAFNA
jgi:hypothetical protein